MLGVPLLKAWHPSTMDFARMLTTGSLLRYAYWRIAKPGTPLAVELRSGVKFFLRPSVSENNDYGVAYEVFVHDYYRPSGLLDRDKVGLVADLGGNVGLSVLHWLALFPNCTVETFEPNPLHVAQMRRNLALSGQEHRVVVHAQAAGARSRTVRFANLGTSSSAHITADDAFDADMVDVFEILGSRRIDLLKLDVEGGEYELLEDPRFGRLDIGVIAMEWHTRGGGGGDIDRQWCERRLSSLGYTIRPLFAEPGHGMFWALRSGAAASERAGSP